MARVLAHEMMNSLTPIASLSQSLDALLRAGGRTEEVSDALETITRRSQGLLRFVERYRQVADLPEPRPQTLPLRPLLENVERLLRPALTARGIALDSRVTPADLSCARRSRPAGTGADQPAAQCRRCRRGIARATHRDPLQDRR